MEDNFLKIAKQAALEAGEIITSYFGKKHQYKFKNKDKSDFATQADLESEQKIVQILTKNFPTHNIIAEENNKIDKGSDYTWAIDPLDGTISYAARVPSFTVSIGLLKVNEPILGVIYHVSSGDLYFGEKSKGAFLNEKKINVNKKNKLESAVVSMDLGHKKNRQIKFNSYVMPLCNKVGYIYNLGSGALALAYTAQGILEAQLQIGGLWDVLAGTIIVKEAGGKVTDLKGDEPDWNKKQVDIVASNGLIHDQILEALKK